MRETLAPGHHRRSIQVARLQSVNGEGGGLSTGQSVCLDPLESRSGINEQTSMAVQRPTHRSDLASNEVQGGGGSQFEGHIKRRSGRRRGRKAAHPFDLDFPVCVDKAIQVVHQPAQQKEPGHNHPNRTGQLSLTATQEKFNARDILLDAPKPGGSRFAGGGKHQALSAAIEELYAQAGLQVLQAAGDRRRVNAQRLGGGAHRSTAHYRREEFEVVPIHCFLLCSRSMPDPARIAAIAGPR